MKYKAGLYKTLGIAALVFFLMPQTALADDVSVNSQSSGQSVTCINGNCTTTGGGGQTTVCHNGQCTTTNDGNVDYTSPDGHTQIHVHNNTSGNSVTTEPSAGAAATSEPTVTIMPSITPDPTIMQMRKDINDKVKKETDAVKEHMKAQDDAITAFINAQMEALKKFLNSLFK